LTYGDFTFEDGEIKDVLDAFAASNTLKVLILGGAMEYTTEGTRASGDGWTTWANTILMISYWRFIMCKSGFKVPTMDSYTYGLKAKGDDVLMNFPISAKTKVDATINKYMATNKDP